MCSALYFIFLHWFLAFVLDAVFMFTSPSILPFFLIELFADFVFILMHCCKYSHAPGNGTGDNIFIIVKPFFQIRSFLNYLVKSFGSRCNHDQ